jgi:hypothetical protein
MLKISAVCDICQKSKDIWHISQIAGIFNVTQQATKKKAP